jgi:hypothetical protein
MIGVGIVGGPHEVVGPDARRPDLGSRRIVVEPEAAAEPSERATAAGIEQEHNAQHVESLHATSSAARQRRPVL